MNCNKSTELINNRLKEYWKTNNAIAFDAASWSSGWAAWRNGLLYSGAIQAPKGMSSAERVAYMANEVRDMMKELFRSNNGHIFLESGIARSKMNAMLLGEVRGAIIGACSNCKSFQEISNSTWKSTLGIRARDSESQKREARNTLSAWWGFEIDMTYSEHYKGYTFDESDAIAVLTHAIIKIDYKEDE